MVKSRPVCMGILESESGADYLYLFAPTTEHSGGQREAGLPVVLGLVPGQCQTLETPGRAPTGVAPARGLTQDETSLQTKKQFTSQVISSCSSVFGSDRNSRSGNLYLSEFAILYVACF